VLFLDKPILALVYLRYGIEWQLWYKALGNDKDIALCDIAALEVIRIFIICYLKTIKRN
jgi:hypothetical protein